MKRCAATAHLHEQVFRIPSNCRFTSRYYDSHRPCSSTRAISATRTRLRVCVSLESVVWCIRFRMRVDSAPALSSAAGEALIPGGLFRRPTRETCEFHPQVTSSRALASPAAARAFSARRGLFLTLYVTHQGFCVLRRSSPAASSSVQSAAAPRCLLPVGGAGRPAGAAQSAWQPEWQWQWQWQWQWHQASASVRLLRRHVTAGACQ